MRNDFPDANAAPCGAVPLLDRHVICDLYRWIFEVLDVGTSSAIALSKGAESCHNHKNKTRAKKKAKSSKTKEGNRINKRMTSGKTRNNPRRLANHK